MKTLRVFKFIGFGILGIGFIFLVIWGVMALWNGLIPPLFNGPVLSYWQTFGLFFLAKILLTGIAPNAGHDKKPNRDWRSRYERKFGRCKDDSGAEEEAKES